MFKIYGLPSMTAGIKAVFDLLSPKHCLLCEELMAHGDHVCDECRRRFFTPTEACCRFCGGRRFHKAEAAARCGRCLGKNLRFEKVITLGEYEYALRDAILRMKTDKTGNIGTVFGTLLFEYRHELLRQASPNLILPIPMHQARRKERGVNGPDFIAEELGRLLNVPTLKRSLARTHRTELQSQYWSEAERRRNVAKAFVLPKIGWFGRPSSVWGRNILLVDDILTTGATCDELTRMLKKAGAKTVTVAVVARAEGQKVDRFATMALEDIW